MLIIFQLNVRLLRMHWLAWYVSNRKLASEAISHLPPQKIEFIIQEMRGPHQKLGVKLGRPVCEY